MKESVTAAFLCLVLSMFAAADVAAAKPVNAVAAGEPVIDPPMLINLGFEWAIAGDNSGSRSAHASLWPRS